MVSRAAPKFLLDANLSPKIVRYLTRQFGFDVYSLLHHGRGEIGDPDVLRLARSTRRVIITLDRDFIEPSTLLGQKVQGVIYLDLPNGHRYIDDIERLLQSFFSTVADDVDLEHSLVILQIDRAIIHRGS